MRLELTGRHLTVTPSLRRAVQEHLEHIERLLNHSALSMRVVRVVRARGYTVRPMTIDEAALEMSDGRSAFLVFRNASNEAVSVIYRRPDGNLGLIEPEA